MRKTRMAPGRVSYTRVATNWRAGRSKVINPGSVGSFGSQVILEKERERRGPNLAGRL